METILVANFKGGSGKTTLVRNLAAAITAKTAIIDLDPQGSLSAWLDVRKRNNPTLIKGIGPADINAALKKIADASFRYCLMDTPPSNHDWIAQIMRFSDLILIPVRPSPDDLRAVGTTLSFAENSHTNFVFVLNAVKPGTKLAQEALKTLAQYGKVAPTVLHDRVAYPEAALKGNGVTESSADQKASLEIQDLLKYVNTQLRKYRRPIDG